MKTLSLLAALLLVGCALDTSETKGTHQIGIVDVDDNPEPGPDYVDPSKSGSGPCTPQESTVVDHEGEIRVIMIPYLCDPRDDNGVRPPDFNEIPQVEQNAR